MNKYTKIKTLRISELQHSTLVKREIMLLDPVELLEQRLREIEAVECNDPEFIRYKLKYKVSIYFLKNNGYIDIKDNRRKMSIPDIVWLQKNIEPQQIGYYAKLFSVSRNTISKVLKIDFAS